MANKVFIDKDDVVVCQVVGSQTNQSVEKKGGEIDASLAQLKGQHMPLLLLDDIRQMGDVPPGARTIVITLGKTLPYDRLAMLGRGGVLRFGANLLLRAMGRSRKVRYFTDYNIALEWLKEI